jgi:hypothetical protein
VRVRAAGRPPRRQDFVPTRAGESGGRDDRIEHEPPEAAQKRGKLIPSSVTVAWRRRFWARYWVADEKPLAFRGIEARPEHGTDMVHGPRGDRRPSRRVYSASTSVGRIRCSGRLVSAGRNRSRNATSRRSRSCWSGLCSSAKSNVAWRCLAPSWPKPQWSLRQVWRPQCQLHSNSGRMGG